MARLYGFEDMAYRRVRESEAEVLRAAASRRLLKQSYDAIVEWMNAEGHRTTRGGQWRPAVLASVLDHPAIAGLEEDENGKLVETGGPVIVSRGDFEAIRAMRRVNDPDKQRAEQREYLIPGPIGVCGLCACTLGSSPTAAGTRGYRCSPSTAQHPGGCGKVRIMADLLETYVAEHVLAELAKPEVSALIGQARDEVLAQAAVLRKEAAAARRRQKKLGEDYARSPDMTLKTFRSADQELKKLVREGEAQARLLEQVKHVPVGDVPDLVRWWKHAPMKAKRGVLVLMLEQVAVYPAASRGSRTVDADRVGLRWRQWGVAAETTESVS
ncbi:recombinase family protein [Streptomyces lunaelactis]|uniref:recombinase family protein n=1 Tax=Streptomyces lunaelactis TaxID=1535768 RepID=UPI001585C001|nr:recombinase family protein [Streptomyces lunaelactis]NUK32326.1 recombinase family protein [Streptomyces lunaelactis]NUK40356.1 recombinase family protein [Streptomyces lunaelactis]